MSGITVWPVTAVAVLCCDRCGGRWQSEPYDAKNGGWRPDEVAARPAFDQGWRVYVGARTQRTYCPDCGPTAPMRLVLPKEDR